MNTTPERTPGMIRMLSGRLLDLTNLQPEDITIEDIAWGLGRTIRYGGQITADYMVANHCVVMSYLVPEEHAKEALLHDAAEAYVGDIIWPVKALFPQVEWFEGQLAHKIMSRFDVEHAHVGSPSFDMDTYPETYVKSKAISEADWKLFEHECQEFGRPGVYHDDVEAAWLKAAATHEQWWHAPAYAYLERFDQLFGTNHLDLDALTKLWFSNDQHSDTLVREAERAVAALGERHSNKKETARPESSGDPFIDLITGEGY